MIRSAVRAATIAIVAIAALVVVPAASAAPADLTSVSQTDRLVSAAWTLPAGATAWVLQVSIDETFDPASIWLYADLGATDTSFIASQPLAGGTYHVRVISTMTPDACVIADPSCAFDVSNARTVTIPSQAATLQAVIHLGGILAASWTLPAGADAWEAQISTSPRRDQSGFPDPIPSSPIGLDPRQTNLATALSLSPGTYYVHIRSTPTYALCIVDDPFCVFEFSNIVAIAVAVTVATPGRPSALTRPRPRPASAFASDKVLALGTVTASSSQDVDKLSITVNPGEAVKVKLSGSVSVPGASKVFRFTTVNRSLGPGKTKLRLKLRSRAMKAIKRALKRKRRLKARLALVVSDTAGNSKSSKYTVRLKP